MILCTVAAACLLAPATTAGAGRPVVSIVATPSRVSLAGRMQQTIRVQNTGSQRVVVDVTRAGFALDLRGRPRIVSRSGVRAATSWLVVRPRLLAIPAGATKRVVVSSRPPHRAEPGDHEALLLLVSRPRRRGVLAVRMRLGVVVVVRTPGSIVRRVVPLWVRVRRLGRIRRLDLMVANRGNISETLDARCLRVSLLRRDQVVTSLAPIPRQLLPRTRGIAEFRYRGRARGSLRARVWASRAPSCVRLRARTFRIRL